MARVSNYKFISSKGCIINSRCNCVVCALYDNSQNILTNRLCFFITSSCILFYIFELADVYTYTLNIYTIYKIWWHFDRTRFDCLIRSDTLWGFVRVAVKSHSLPSRCSYLFSSHVMHMLRLMYPMSSMYARYNMFKDLLCV